MSAVNSVYALYPDPDSAQRAVVGLRAAGVADRAIVVASSEPFEEYEFSHRDKATWLHWIAGMGGAAGLGFAYWLTTTIPQRWPLVTGGMPIVAMWPNLIVMFELTMLGAILATVVTLFLTAKLARRAPQLYDPEISDGLILVGVENPPAATVETLRQVLETSGAGRVKLG